MFGARYNRLTFWIWSVLLMIPQIFVMIISKAPMGDIENTSTSTLFFVFFILMLPSLLWMNTLANRIRDYGSNPWIAVFSLIPLANIGLALYYGIVQYKNKPVENNTNIDNSPSLTKAVYNHSKDIASEIKPTINEYKEKHQTSRTDTSNISSIDEDAIYEKVMIEIEEDNKVKSTWAKALTQSEGDKDKAEAIYINLRFNNLLAETESTKVDKKNTKKTQLNKDFNEKDKKTLDDLKKALSNKKKKTLTEDEQNYLNKLQDYCLKNNIIDKEAMSLINYHKSIQSFKYLLIKYDKNIPLDENEDKELKKLESYYLNDQDRSSEVDHLLKQLQDSHLYKKLKKSIVSKNYTFLSDMIVRKNGTWDDYEVIFESPKIAKLYTKDDKLFEIIEL